MKKANKKLNAAIIVIGNEILSGRTQDVNVINISNWLNKLGIKLEEVEDFIKELNDFVRLNEPDTYDYNYSLDKDKRSITLLEKYTSSKVQN